MYDLGKRSWVPDGTEEHYPENIRDISVLKRSRPVDFLKYAHGIDPSLGKVQYLRDGWTIVHDARLAP